MAFFRSRFLPLYLALLAAGAFAQTPPTPPSQNDAHHPPGAASAPASKAKPPAAPRPGMARVDAQMKAMQDMHGKMMNAKTPEERNSLMAEHMKTMQDGMAMMNEMSSGGMAGMQGDMGARQQMMEKRMEMMRSMMQMMMDRMPAPATR